MKMFMMLALFFYLFPANAGQPPREQPIKSQSNVLAVIMANISNVLYI